MRFEMLTATVMLLASLGVTAQTTVVVVQPNGPSLGDGGKKDFERAGQGIGNLLFGALHKKQAKSLVLVIKCEHYVTALITYDDGSLKSIDLTKGEDSNAVDRTELTAYQTALPTLHVVEGGCQ
jgi:hypothetical protein